jgi:hypothetical protein
MRSASLFVLLATALACALFAAPAQAQRDRVFVASYGSDSNPCTFGSPCKTFQNAFSVVAAGGEITAIDSAGFGPLTIDKAVTITSPNGVEAGIAAPSGDTAVTIQAETNDVVVLNGLTLEGAGTGMYGIAFESGAELDVVNCTVRNYTSAGIVVEPASSAMSLLVSNTIVSDMDTGTGIFLLASAGSIQAALDNVTLNNSSAGLVALASGRAIEVQVSSSHVDNNLTQGILAGGNSSFSASVILKDVTLNQEPDGVVLDAYSTVWLSGVIQGAASGFGTTMGVKFSSGTGTAAYSDNTNHLMGGIAGSGTLQTWTSN